MRILFTVFAGALLVGLMAVAGNCDQLSPYLTDEGVDVQFVSPEFVRGDVQADSDHDLFDAIYLLNWLGGINPEPDCVNACDVQDDEDADLFDAIYLLNWLGGLNPPPPSPCCGIPDNCGPDPTPGPLTCGSYEPCGWNP